MQTSTNRLRKALVPFAVVALSAAGLTACGGNSNSAGGSSSGGASGGSGGGKELAVTLITKTSTNPFFIAMQKGAEAAGKANNVKITTAAGKADGDETTQISAIDAAVARGDDGILITPATNGVNPAIQQARDAGLYVIALDTPPNPPDTVDITFATDNFKAGELIGKWAAGTLGGKKATIALLDLFNDKIASVDYNRDQGFLTGMGIDTKDKMKNGDEDKTGKYTGGKGGDYTIVCNEPSGATVDGGKTAMETCLSKNPDINVVYSINEPAGEGAAQALKGTDNKVLAVSVDGGCQGVQGVKDGTFGATSQQYPVKMAQLGVEAIVKIARGGEKPKVTEGLDFFNTGVALVTDQPVAGLESIDTTKGAEVCWGTKS